MVCQVFFSFPLKTVSKLSGSMHWAKLIFLIGKERAVLSFLIINTTEL